jgi:CubicO group peptidase (beta-lactamase class C family)
MNLSTSYVIETHALSKTYKNVQAFKSLFFLNCGLVVALLASLGTSVATPVGVNAETLNQSGNLLLASTKQDDPNAMLDEKLAQFEEYLAGMRTELSIPGMSVAIVKDQELIWAQGFGYADVEASRPATPDTPYEIASLTKALSSTILLRLVEQGKVNLDDPVSKYGVYIKSPGIIRVKHLLSMTSQREPGSVFLYNGNRYSLLQKVIERASGRPFPALVSETILNPLGMSDSIGITMVDQPAYAHIRERLSIPYGMDGTYFPRFNPAAGLVSTAPDLAKFDIALDQGKLIGPETRALAFTAQELSSGDPPVYGLGWFVQEFQGTKLVWAFGYDSFTHLYVKFVDQGYTLIILTNSTALGEYVSMQDRSVMRSPAVLAFYKLFIRDLGLDDQVDWNADEAAIALQLQAARQAGTLEIAKQELYNRYLAYWLSGRTVAAQELIAPYTRSFVTAAPPAFTTQPPLVQIEQVGDDAYAIVEFTLAQDTSVDIYAVGEYWQYDMGFIAQEVDYGGIEDVSSGELIWEMTPESALPAGGCVVNRQQTDRIDLAAGTYRLHYRTSMAHSFDNWTCLPPDNLFWGIALYPVGGEAGVTTRDIVPEPGDDRLASLTCWNISCSPPAISNLEYGILWTCLGILLSVLVAVPVLRWRKNSRGGATNRAWRWAKFAGWVAWVNSLLCTLLVLVLMMMNGLEYFVANPIFGVEPSTWVFVGSSYLCIALTIVQAVMAALAWKGKQRSLAERLYYSLATVAAAGYLVLLGTWGMIVALY